MSETKNNFIHRLIHSPWLITLVSSMLGIIAGLYLTNYNEERLLIKGQEETLKKVITEIENNHQTLINFNDSLNKYYEPFHFVTSIIDENLEIIIPKDSLKSFLQQSKLIFTLIDTEPHTKQKENIIVNGTLAFEIISGLLIADLSHVTWDMYKQSNYTAVTAFNCLTSIESLYDAQEKINQHNQEFMDAFLLMAIAEKNDELLSTVNNLLDKWKMLLLRQQMLLEFYETKDKGLENCN